MIGILAAVSNPGGDATDSRPEPAVFIELKTKGVAGWERIDRGLRSVDVDLFHTFTERVAETLVTRPKRTQFQLAWDQDKGNTMLRAIYENRNEAVYHGIGNPAYSFELIGKAKQPGGELRGVKTANKDSGGGKPPTPLGFDEHFRSARAASQFYLFSLREMIESPEFEMLEAVELPEEGERRIRFSVRYLGDNGPFGTGRRNGLYTVIVDPVHNYRVVRKMISFQDWVDGQSDEYEVEINYHSDPQIFVPRSVRGVLTQSGQKVVTEWVTEFELPRKNEIPEAEFHLEHYGFDESILSPVSPNRWLRWLLMAVGVASLALGYRLLARRRLPR